MNAAIQTDAPAPSNRLTPLQITEHHHTIEKAEAAAKLAKRKAKEAWDAFAEAGGDVKMLKFTRRLGSADTLKRISTLNSLAEYCRALDVPEAKGLPIFDVPAAEASLNSSATLASAEEGPDVMFQQGRAARLRGEARQCPSGDDDPLAPHWYAGWDEADAELN